MKQLLIKYKGIILMLFLGIFISTIDSYVLNGQFKGIEEHKHFIYIGCLLLGLAVTLSILLREEKPEE